MTFPRPACLSAALCRPPVSGNGCSSSELEEQGFECAQRVARLGEVAGDDYGAGRSGLAAARCVPDESEADAIWGLPVEFDALGGRVADLVGAGEDEPQHGGVWADVILPLGPQLFEERHV